MLLIESDLKPLREKIEDEEEAKRQHMKKNNANVEKLRREVDEIKLTHEKLKALFESIRNYEKSRNKELWWGKTCGTFLVEVSSLFN